MLRIKPRKSRRAHARGQRGPAARSRQRNKGRRGPSRATQPVGAQGLMARPTPARIPTPVVARRRRKWGKGARRGRGWESFSGARRRREASARARARPAVAAVTVLGVRRLAPRPRSCCPLPCRARGGVSRSSRVAAGVAAPPLPALGFPGAAATATSAVCMRRRRM